MSGPLPTAAGRCRGESLTCAPAGGEAGSGGVLVLAVAALLVAVAVAMVLVGSAVTARHRAASIADLAALAGAAHALAGPATACSAALSVAAGDQGRLERCHVEDQDVVVTVTVGIRIGSSSVQARATARAGPAAGTAAVHASGPGGRARAGSAGTAQSELLVGGCAVARAC